MANERPYDNPKTPDYESFPKIEIVVTQIIRATQAAAISAATNIATFTGDKPEVTDLEKAEKDRRTKIIDTDANSAFLAVLHKAPVQFHGIDAEGAKEAAPDKLGEAMPLAVGVFGNGDEKATFVVDVVEGTTAAAHGRANAISIVGVSTHGGITKIPALRDGRDATYFRKLFAPAAFKDDLSLEESAQANLRAIMRSAQIRAEAITVAVMKRTCNATIIREAQELGAKVQLVSAGDLAWCLRALASDPEHPIIMLGRGGAEEGSIAAVAARALGATGQLRVIEEREDIEVVDITPIWTADEFVPGVREHSMVIFSAITESTHFGLRAVNPHNEIPYHYIVESVIVSSTGFRKESSAVLFPQAAS